MTDARILVIDIDREVFHRSGHPVVDIVRDEVVNDGLAATVFKMITIKENKGIDTAASPAPVEVEIVVAVVAVTNEGMTTIGALA